MVSKTVLKQYIDLQEEIKEVREKISHLEKQIQSITRRIEEIEDKGETVKDKVRGGLGGIQSFNIEGVPIKEYQKKKSDLMLKKLLLNQRKSTLEILEYDLLQQTNEVEEFIAGISDSRIRRIVNFRFIQNLSWNKVADKIGGGNTEDSIKKIFYRYMETN